MGFVLATGCHAHNKPDKVVVVKKGNNHKKVVLIDNDHKRHNYRIVQVKPKNHSVCKKHHKHWHCL